MNTDRRVGSTNISPAFVEHESGEGDTRGKLSSGKKFEKEWLDSLTQKKQEKHTHTSVTSRVPSNTYLVVDSGDRFQTSSTTPSIVNLYQPWNQFIVQKPQNLSSVFPNRISVSEINMPWYIPNIITGYNDELYLYVITGASVNKSWFIKIDQGFYTPNELATAINTAIAALPTTTLNPQNYFNFTVDNKTQQMKITAPNSVTVAFNIVSFTNITNLTVLSDLEKKQASFESGPSLCKTIGLDWDQVSQLNPTNNNILANPSKFLYTNYIDIVSTKLCYYSEKDATTSQDGIVNNLVCRVFCNTETSVPQYDASGNLMPAGCRPFTITRQFRNPKNIRWDNSMSIDWLDFAVYDQYGLLVPLPSLPGSLYTLEALPVPSKVDLFEGSYPDFQITLLASEE